MLDAAGFFDRGIGDGLEAREREILSHWDAGADVAAIAALTGKSARAVGKVVSLYDDRPDAAEFAQRERLRAANDAHVAAIERLRMKSAPASERALMPVELIEEKLKDQAEAVFRELFPNAVKQGPEICIGNLAGDRGDSLKMNVGNGSRRGWWRDFSGTEGGDVLNLIRDAVCGGDKKRAIIWAKSFLRIDDTDRAAIERHRIEASAAREARAKKADAERAKKLKNARRRWLEGRKLTSGDPVARYLEGRGIDLVALGRAPGALRYHEALAYGYKGPLVPAMVAQVNNLAGEHIATHRTWIMPDGSGKAGPELIGRDSDGAPNDPKKIMGSPLGGHIALWKGAHRCPLKDIPAGTDVYVSEGIEDGLTAACADPSLRVICMIALGYLGALELPPQMGRLVILKQNDPPGSEAAKLLQRAVATHRAAGRRVFFVDPPAGTKDLNDLACNKAPPGTPDEPPLTPEQQRRFDDMMRGV